VLRYLYKSTLEEMMAKEDNLVLGDLQACITIAQPSPIHGHAQTASAYCATTQEGETMRQPTIDEWTNGRFVYSRMLKYLDTLDPKATMSNAWSNCENPFVMLDMLNLSVRDASLRHLAGWATDCVQSAGVHVFGTENNVVDFVCAACLGALKLPHAEKCRYANPGSVQCYAEMLKFIWYQNGAQEDLGAVTEQLCYVVHKIAMASFINPNYSHCVEELRDIAKTAISFLPKRRQKEAKLQQANKLRMAMSPRN